MTSVHSSNLIGAQAYASQLRRQYTQEETERAIVPYKGVPYKGTPDNGVPDSRRAARADGDARNPAVSLGIGQKNQQKQVLAAQQLATAKNNPTIGDVIPQQNPPAKPLYSSARREAPNPNAALRHTRPGTHLDITV